MKIFISWSGDRSKLIAKALREWLPHVIQCVQPFMSETDVMPGTRWRTVIAKNLEHCKVGIICVTKDNYSAPWLLFEAGAIAKAVDNSLVCPLLIDLDPGDLAKSPLSEFQCKKMDKNSIQEVITVLNSQSENPISGLVIESTFLMYWPKLESTLESIPVTRDEEAPNIEVSSEVTVKDIILQIQSLGKMISRRNELSHFDKSQFEFYPFEEQQFSRTLINSLNQYPMFKDLVKDESTLQKAKELLFSYKVKRISQLDYLFDPRIYTKIYNAARRVKKVDSENLLSLDEYFRCAMIIKESTSPERALE